MQWTWEMEVLQKMYPNLNLTWGHIEALSFYWREFYEHPQKWKGTELEEIVLEWLESDEGKVKVEKYNNSIMY